MVSEPMSVSYTCQQSNQGEIPGDVICIWLFVGVVQSDNTNKTTIPANTSIQANTRPSLNDVPMLGQRRRRCTNIETTVAECLVFAWMLVAPSAGEEAERDKWLNLVLWSVAEAGIGTLSWTC